MKLASKSQSAAGSVCTCCAGISTYHGCKGSILHDLYEQSDCSVSVHYLPIFIGWILIVEYIPLPIIQISKLQSNIIIMLTCTVHQCQRSCTKRNGSTE